MDKHDKEMITVGLVGTTQPERCGIRVYNEELIENCKRDSPDILFIAIGRNFDGSIVQRCKDVDVVHVSHVCNLYGDFRLEHVEQLRKMGKKLVCTWHDCSNINRSAFTNAFDRVVLHQKTDEGFDLIYHGVPHVELFDTPRVLDDFIGTSGFPLPFKNYPLAAKLARSVNKKLYAFLPESNHGDVRLVSNEILRECPGSIIKSGFPPHEEIVRTLSQCHFSLFPYNHETMGIGGSMRVGIGAQRPVIISNVVRFLDVLSEERFKKEFYVIPSSYPTFDSAYSTVWQCIEDIKAGCEKIPVETLKEMSWRESAKKYANIYREVMK